jgi:hypothetical protein
MKAQMTNKRDWFAMDGPQGITFIDAADAPELRPFENGDFSAFANDIRGHARKYYGSEVWNVDKVTGYGIRSSLPGFMDCTEWSVYETLEEAEAAFDEERERNKGTED